MTDERDKAPENVVARRRLAKETGITEDLARELVGFLGPHSWPSLVREARMLRKP